MKHFLSLLCVGVAAGTSLLVPVASARAQGCIVGRQCTPGAVGGGNFLMPRELELAFNYRTFRADRHYNGTTFQPQRQELNNYVINRQNVWDVTTTLGMTRRSNLVLSIPLIDSGWSIPRPIGSATSTPGPRAQQNGNGLGDISALWKTWLRDPGGHGAGNVALGFGVKFPTGKANVTNMLPDRNGENIAPRVIDQSIQPGDGSWGFPVSVEAYHSVGKGFTAFATVNYLISPRDTNGVPSGRNPTAVSPSIDVYSVPDQYLYRLGVGGAIPGVPGLSASLSWRKEGVPQTDLVGGHHGWRRPGYSVSVEPSVSYVRNQTAYTLAVPITQFRNRIPTNTDGTPVAGDSTFAAFQIVLNVSKRVTLR